MFKGIVMLYCVVGLALNLILLPRRNKLAYGQNEYVLERYKQLERVLNKLEKKVE